MIKCPYCNLYVEVVGGWENFRLADHGDCRGSNAPVRGNWRDDPTLTNCRNVTEGEV